MPILHLDSIMPKGITCMKCGGNLKPVSNRSTAEKIISAVTFGKVKVSRFGCEKCRKQHFVTA